MCLSAYPPLWTHACHWLWSGRNVCQDTMYAKTPRLYGMDMHSNGGVSSTCVSVAAVDGQRLKEQTAD